MGATPVSPALILLLLTMGTPRVLCFSKKVACHNRTPDWSGDGVKIPLQCEGQEWIHVISERVAVRGDETQCNYNDSCSLERKDDTSRLSVQCSRRSSCSEVVDLGGLTACDRDLQADYVAVSYECVPGSAVYDLRSESPNPVSGAVVYLSTIGNEQNVFVRGSDRLQRCRLTASGSGSVSVEALELYFKLGVELNITGHCKEGEEWVLRRTGEAFVNRRLYSFQCSSADITFHDHGLTPHLAWLRFKAASNLTLTCGHPDLAMTSPSTQVKVIAVTGTGEMKERGENPMSDDPHPIALTIGIVLAALVVLVVVLAVVFIVLRRRKANAQPESKENTSRGENSNEPNASEHDKLLAPSLQAPANSASPRAAEQGEGGGEARGGEGRPGRARADEDALVYNVLYESSRGKSVGSALAGEEEDSQTSDVSAAHPDALHYAVSGSCPGYGVVRPRTAGESGNDVMGVDISHDPSKVKAVTPRGQAVINGGHTASDQSRNKADQDCLVYNVLYESFKPTASADGGEERGRQPDSKEGQPSTDNKEDHHSTDNKEGQPSTDSKQQDKDCLVYNVLYESCRPQPDKTSDTEGK